jgi:hypothetical protein
MGVELARACSYQENDFRSGSNKLEPMGVVFIYCSKETQEYFAW